MAGLIHRDEFKGALFELDAFAKPGRIPPLAKFNIDPADPKEGGRIKNTVMMIARNNVTRKIHFIVIPLTRQSRCRERPAIKLLFQ
jgi:hypothetical protein